MSRRRIDGWRVGAGLPPLLLLFTALPMIWMLLTSIKSQFAAMQFPPQWWPDKPTLASYQKLLSPTASARTSSLLLEQPLRLDRHDDPRVIVAVPAAYAFSRFRFPGRNILFFAVLLRNMFPAVIFLVPLFILMR